MIILNKGFDDEVWNNRYSLVIKNIPNFFNKNISIKLFEIGKCVNFIRNYCENPNFSMLKLKEKIVRIGEEKIKNSAEMEVGIDGKLKEKLDSNRVLEVKGIDKKGSRERIEEKVDNKMIIDDETNNIEKDIIFQGSIMKFSKKTNSVKPFFMTILGEDIYYYTNETKDDLIHIHNLSGCFIKENE